MAFTQDFAIGRTQRLVATLETTIGAGTYGTVVQPILTGTSGELAIRSAGADYKQERKNRNDRRATRSLVERITGKKTTSWSAECYCYTLPNVGTPTFAPVVKGVHSLWRAVFGAHVGTSGADGTRNVAYTLNDTQNGLDSLDLNILEGFETGQFGVSMETVIGAWVDEWKLSVSGGEEAIQTFSGGGKNTIYTGTTTTTQSRAGSETTVTVTDPEVFEVGSLFAIGTSAGTTSGDPAQGDGHVLVSKTGSTLTFTPAIVGAQASGVNVVPYIRTSNTAATDTYPFGKPAQVAIAGITGRLDIGSDTLVPITAFEITVKNGIKAVDQEAFRDTPRDFIPGMREVTGTITILLTRTQAKRLGQRRDSFATKTLTLYVGGTALDTTPTGTNRFVVTIPRAEIEFSAVESPEAEEATFTLPFVALATAAGANEFTFTVY